MHGINKYYDGKFDLSREAYDLVQELLYLFVFLILPIIKLVMVLFMVFLDMVFGLVLVIKLVLLALVGFSGLRIGLVSNGLGLLLS